ncbi:hypothetical protein H0A71_06410 [Alcaligenaceae bacterium]|nr:hypothetical protein [Alcaligenaceae bacterium]
MIEIEESLTERATRLADSIADDGLDAELVWQGLACALRDDKSFMGRSPDWWKSIICETVFEQIDGIQAQDYDAYGLEQYVNKD